MHLLQCLKHTLMEEQISSLYSRNVSATETDIANLPGIYKSNNKHRETYIASLT